ncbi:uncharacterized protein LOC107263407 [Cephus cinctus]|uniref:Uncharacterized protein LOC107263407 n=1 Tax=Cephus cinctus TaxID=211228 RepID=A0AAJ7FD92_CEPCN|nr:uncharacterized protein LOC107263407 [Cephus cinctus]XP_015586071.1 uncharacterized protein LOC107263407 [Cephus cinctus]
MEVKNSDIESLKSDKHIKRKKFKRLKAETDMKESEHVNRPEKVSNKKRTMQTLKIEYEHTKNDSKKERIKKCNKSDTDSDSKESKNLYDLDIGNNVNKETEGIQIKTETSEDNLLKSDCMEKTMHGPHKSVKSSKSSLYVPSWMKSDSDISDSENSDSENSDSEKVNISSYPSSKPIHKKYRQSIEVMEETEIPTCDVQEDIKTLLEIKKFQERIPRELLQYLRRIKVNLRHKVPIQHTIESKTGSHTPTPEENERFESIIPITKGSFTPAEDKIIVENWEAFCKAHNWNPKNVQPFLYFKQYGKFCMPSVKERRKFVQFLADGLPSRTLYSVYHRFRNLYEPHKQSRYNSNEDSYILSLFKENTTLNQARKFADLGKILNRTRASVYRRYRLLKRKQEMDNNLSIT